MFNKIDTAAISKNINKLNDDYLINIGDELTLKLYSRKGVNLVEAIKTTVTNNQESNLAQSATFVVANNGTIYLPVLGIQKVAGMTESQLKQMLEQKFQKDYVDPFVYLRVENRRVFLFKGEIGAVVQLNRTPTSIFEVIAKSGGLQRHMSTEDILIVRGDLKNPTVFKVNLQTFEGMQHSETILQTNDIVYIPEKRRKLYHAIQDIGPIITTPLAVLSTTISTVLLYLSISK